jgi:hypothetical protein
MTMAAVGPAFLGQPAKFEVSLYQFVMTDASGEQLFGAI